MDAITVGTGIVNGFALALVALGFTVVYRATGVVNFANGSQMVLGGYISWQLGTALGVPAWLAIVGAVVVGMASGLLLDQFAMRPLRRASLLAQVILLLAVTEAAAVVFLQVFGPDAKTIDAYAGREPVLDSLSWSAMDITLMVISAGMVVLLAVALNTTRTGLRMRMVADNPTGATLVGVNPSVSSSLAWSIGGGLAALSGALIFPTYLLVPEMGEQYTFDSFAAVALGGFGSLPGAIVGGLVIGVVQAVVGAEIGATYGPFVSLAVMLAVFLIKPAGLMGAKTS